jgi:surface polysaccharide O-acyltransferase-like enzyme
MAQAKSKRIFYFDALRAFAIIAVIIIHIFNSTRFMTTPDYAVIPSFNWFISCFLGSAFRVGVPLFLMLSGALSLGRVWDIKSFLKKRIPRITVPFIFWGFVLSVFMVAVSYYFGFIHTIDPFNFDGFIHYLYNSYMYENEGFTPYWFFWMILGVYLIMPVFNKWILNSDLKELEYFLILWLITCIFDFTLFIEFPINLSYFSGPIGLVVAGYYFSHTERKVFNSPYWALLICFIGFVMAAIAYYLLSDASHSHLIDRYSIMNVTLAIGIFLLFRNFSKFGFHPGFLYNPDGLFRKAVFSLATYSYGMYLIHRVVMQVVYRYFKNNLDFIPFVLLLFVTTFFISWAIMAISNRIPYLNELIGVK